MVALTPTTSNESYIVPSPYAWLRSRAPVPTKYAPACEPLSAFDDVLENRASRARVIASSCTGVVLVSRETASSYVIVFLEVRTIHYNGEGIDNRTGLYNFRARWYSASSGRFERLDPFAGNPSDPFSFNKYGFVHGNPIMGADPTGLFFGLGGISVTLGIQLNMSLSTIVTGSVVATTLSTIGAAGARIRNIGIERLARGDLEALDIIEMGSRIMSLGFETASFLGEAIDLAQVGFGIAELVIAAPRLLLAGAKALKNIGSRGRAALKAVNVSPQIVKELGKANLQKIDPNTYLQGLENLESFASQNGWRIITDKAGEVVNLGKKAANVDVDYAARTIRINLTADVASQVRVIEFADEISHAVNAIRGVADGNSMRQHIGNFIDAIGSRLIPYTQQEKQALGKAVDVMDKYKDLFDGT